MTIYVDIHEPSSMSTKLKHLGVDVKVMDLKVGDYWVGDAMIERKTIDDFLRSIVQKRYYKQLYNMMKNTKKGMVYITGVYPKVPPMRRVGGKLRPIDIESVLRTHRIVSYYSFRIPVFHVSSDDDLIKDLLEYHTKSGKNVSLKPLDIRRKADSLEDIRTNIFGSIPGIGRKTANYLGKHLSLESVFSMSVDELRDLKVGNKRLGKRGEHIYNVFHDKR